MRDPSLNRKSEERTVPNEDKLLLDAKDDWEYPDYFRSSRNATLSKYFGSFPSIDFNRLEIKFHIGRAKNAYLVHLVLDRIPDESKIIDENKVAISIAGIDSFISLHKCIIDLLSIVGNWRSLEMEFNSVAIDWLTLRYLASYYEDILNTDFFFRKRSTAEIRKDYSGRHRTNNSKERIREQVFLDHTNIHKAVRLVTDNYIQKYLTKLSYREYVISDYEIVLDIEDSLVVSFSIFCTARDAVNPEIEEVKRYRGTGNFTWYDCVIQEHTPNQLFKFNNAAFMRAISGDHCTVKFLKYKGFMHYQTRWQYDTERDITPELVSQLPNLGIQERCRSYPGDLYHYVVFEMESPEGIISRGIGFTKGKVSAFVLKVCKELEERNSTSLLNNGVSSLLFRESREFCKSFLAWKGTRKRWRLENKLSYFSVDAFVKDENDLYNKHLNEILQGIKEGRYNQIEKGTYSKPSSKWKTEELVLKTVSKLYGKYGVVSQYRPAFLKSDTGYMSYDVYICGLRVVIEYQGKQHFEPVDFFGGEASHEKQVERDRLKRQLSADNGIRLVYVNYWEDVTPALIKEKIEDAVQQH